MCALHFHQKRDATLQRMACKFWLEPIELAANHGFTARELNTIRRRVHAHVGQIIEAWYEHCRQH